MITTTTGTLGKEGSRITTSSTTKGSNACEQDLNCATCKGDSNPKEMWCSPDTLTTYKCRSKGVKETYKFCSAEANPCDTVYQPFDDKCNDKFKCCPGAKIMCCQGTCKNDKTCCKEKCADADKRCDDWVDLKVQSWDCWRPGDYCYAQKFSCKGKPCDSNFLVQR